MKKIEVKIGDKYNDFVVISEIYRSKDIYRDKGCKKGVWVVKTRCKCGQIKETPRSQLRQLTQCTKCRGRLLRYYKVGDKINKLEILGYVEDIVDKSSNIKVRCNCGNIYITSPSYIKKNDGCRRCYECPRGKESHRYNGGKYITGTYYRRTIKRARKKNIPFDVDIKLLDELLEQQNHNCSLSKLPIKVGFRNEETTASLDRIDSNKGYIKGNVQWVHKVVQKMKMELDEKTFVEFCTLICRNKNVQDEKTK